MKLEFIKDSVELEEFAKTLKFKDQHNIEGDLDDYHSFDAIYYQQSSGKYYSVRMETSGSMYSKVRYSTYHRNFKNSEPLVVDFYEVKPVEVVRIEWEMCEEVKE